MITFNKYAVKLTPYPHLASDMMLDPAFFTELQREFPDGSVFAANRKQAFAGGRASRINLGRGDRVFRAFMQQSPAWREFFHDINSRRFVETVLGLFGEILPEQGCSIDAKRWNFRDHITTPEQTVLRRLMRKVGVTNAIDRILSAFDSGSLCIDFDIAWAQNGYATEPHTDNRNKLAAMLIYFGETGGEGGDFQVLKLKQMKPLHECGRYPGQNELEVVETLRPKPNRGALFLNCNNSYHVVTPLINSAVARQFLYVSVSSCYGAPIWRYDP